MRIRAWVGLLATMLGVAACSGSQSIENTTWVLESLTGTDVVADNPGTLLFADGAMAGSTGCNQIGGTYSTDGDSISFGPIRSTMVACPDPGLSAQESAMMKALEATTTYSATEEAMELRDRDGSVLATFARRNTDLAGTSWTVVAYNTGTQAVRSLIAETEITLSFGTDGLLSGSSGCNTYRGSYEVSGEYHVFDGQAIEVSTFDVTEMACPSPEGIMEQEAAYLEALGSAGVWRSVGASLELRSQGALLVQAIPAG